MRRKTVLWIVIGGILAAVLASAAFFFRPKTIYDGTQTLMVREPVLRVGQALAAAGMRLDPADQVTPTLDAWLPLDGQVRVTRASHIVVWEDGRISRASGVAAQAGDLLAEAGITLADGDRLSWNGLAADTGMALEAGASYVLQVERAATLRISEDGQARSAQVRAATLAGALWKAGVQLAPGDLLSDDPGSAMPLKGGSISLARARPLTIRVQEQAIAARSAADSVGEALQDAGVSLQGLDYSLPEEDQPLPEDGEIQVVRVSEALALEQTLLPFETSLQPDPTLELDQRRTLEAGQYGIQVSRVRIRYEDGQEVSRGLDSDWIASPPRTQVTGYGTLAAAHTTDTPDGTIEYWRAVTVYATGYSPCRLGRPNYCNERTASGAKLTKGIIAVSQPWYRLMAGQQVYVPGYGFGLIADTGYGIPGTPWIDLGYDDDNFVGGGRTVTMYFLTPIPENVPWTLP
jgi:resuscitation-promoting factor RpfB